MSEPTAYDLTQDEKIAEHSELLQVSDVAATGNQISYPVVGQPMSESMWGNVTRGIGNGILDTGGSPYWLDPADIDNATNTAIIRVDRFSGEASSIIQGFFHTLRENMVIDLPPVSATTVYNICLTFDPLLSQAADGPISLRVYAGDPPKNGGKVHVLLYKITRRANQLLTDATITRSRARIAPQLLFATVKDLPDPAGQLWGTIATVHTTGERFMAVSNSGMPDEWRNLTEIAESRNDTGWANVGGSVWPSSNAQARRIGNQIWFRGQWITESGLSNGGSVRLYNDSFPRQFRPVWTSRFVCAANYTGNSPNWGYQMSVYMTPEGTVEIHNHSGRTMNAVTLDNVSFLAD